MEIDWERMFQLSLALFGGALLVYVALIFYEFYNTPERQEERRQQEAKGAYERKFEEIKPSVLAAVKRDERSGEVFSARLAVREADLMAKERRWDWAMWYLESARRRAQGLPDLPHPR